MPEPRESGDGVPEAFTTRHDSHKVAVPHTPYRDVMRIARIAACCIVASLIPLTIAATPSIAGPATASTAKVKFRAPQGPALVRIDAPSATVVAKNPAAKSFTLTLNDPKKVRWMGEVKNSRGQQSLGYGELPASQLAASWKTLGNSANGVLATLTWNTRSADPGYALVRLRTPAVKSRQMAAGADQSKDAMTATITTLAPIPKALTDVSLNVNRSAGKQNRAYATTTFYVTNEMTMVTTQVDAATVQVKVFCGVEELLESFIFLMANPVPSPDLSCADARIDIPWLSVTTTVPDQVGSVYVTGTLRDKDHSLPINSVIATVDLT